MICQKGEKVLENIVGKRSLNLPVLKKKFSPLQNGLLSLSACEQKEAAGEVSLACVSATVPSKKQQTL